MYREHDHHGEGGSGGKTKGFKTQPKLGCITNEECKKTQQNLTSTSPPTKENKEDQPPYSNGQPSVDPRNMGDRKMKKEGNLPTNGRQQGNTSIQPKD